MNRFVAIILAAVTASGGMVRPAVAAEPPDPRDFLYSAAQAGMMEVEAAKLAVTVSTNAAVKEYGYRMIYDHQKMNEDLAAIAQKRSVSLPTALDAKRAAALQALSETPQPEFDSAYLAQMVRDHDGTVELLQANLLNADPELAVFSSYNLPRIKEHKRLAEQERDGLTGKSPQHHHGEG